MITGDLPLELGIWLDKHISDEDVVMITIWFIYQKHPMINGQAFAKLFEIVATAHTSYKFNEYIEKLKKIHRKNSYEYRKRNKLLYFMFITNRSKNKLSMKGWLPLKVTKDCEKMIIP